jgi:hypothetical protein
MVGRYLAGATGLPFFPLRSYAGSDLPSVNPAIRTVESPYGDGAIAVVPPLRPDLVILHAQRADPSGNTQLWGLLGVQKEAAFAARKLVVVVEEVVSEDVIRSDPNRTLIPGLVVDAVVHAPFGAHPAYVQGFYDRDNQFYLEWDRLSRDEDRTLAWLDEWVHGVPDRADRPLHPGGHGLDDLLRERAVGGRGADQNGGLRVPDRVGQCDRPAAPSGDLCGRPGVRLLIVPQVIHVVGEQPLLVDQPDPAGCVVPRPPVQHYGVPKLVADANARCSGAEDDNPLFAHRDAGHLQGRQHAGEGDRPGPLHVVVEDPERGLVLLKNPPGIAEAEILEVQQGVRE